ncbi:E3 binding domain-containing protein [Mesorhizobium sp. IMUNJ 23232]|uniref:E3 binding domain-containing protein n=1 Tax=Mesorhizobium sp. IMUNJ 23232 TaxID=3376064 RepID=UPI00379CB5E0
MTIAVASTPSSGRIRATPYARRLARERNVLLSAVTGSGPNGRITGDDLIDFRAPQIESVLPPAPTILVSADPAPAIAESQKITVAAAPSAIAVRVDFSAMRTLLAQVRELRPDVTREDICLKAAAVASETAKSVAPDKALLLLTAPDKCQRLNGLADASLGAIAKLRQSSGDDGRAALAVSFLGRAGIRPVAVRLIDDGAARLVIGAEENDGSAECLLSYDPARISDEDAEEFLGVFRDLVETPFRLLV